MSMHGYILVQYEHLYYMQKLTAALDPCKLGVETG